MKSLRFAKFQITDTLSAIIKFYIIFILVIGFIIFVSHSAEGSARISGLDFASVIFLFIAGLNSFKDSFKFSQANNISRKTYFCGLIAGVFPVALLMSVVDLILNRVYNIFIPSITNFDLIYREFEINTVSIGYSLNSFFGLIEMGIWQFALYSMVFIAGIFVSALYYRSNRVMKVFVSILPVLLLIVLTNVNSLIPLSFWYALKDFLLFALGIGSQNAYMAVMTFIATGAVISIFLYLLIKRAVARD